MINEKVISKIRKSKACKLELQTALDKSASTIQRYIDNKDIMLTTVPALKAIKKTLKIKDNEIFN